MLQLANYDDDLQYFFQHTAVLLTADTKYVGVSYYMVELRMVNLYILN